jgi:hypothetical protein
MKFHPEVKWGMKLHSDTKQFIKVYSEKKGCVKVYTEMEEHSKLIRSQLHNVVTFNRLLEFHSETKSYTKFLFESKG